MMHLFGMYLYIRGKLSSVVYVLYTFCALPVQKVTVQALTFFLF